MQRALQGIQKTETLESVERLDKLMGVQATIEKMRVWPLDPSELAHFSGRTCDGDRTDTPTRFAGVEALNEW